MPVTHYAQPLEQTEFFARYPVPRDMVRRIAKRYGYSSGTIQGWIRPNGIRMNRAAFEAMVRDFLLPLYPDMDSDYVELTAATLPTRRVAHVNLAPKVPTPTSTASVPVAPHSAREEIAMPNEALKDPQPALADLIRAFATFEVLRTAIDLAPLDAEQRLALVALLAAKAA
jgi:hypothetical protein